MFEFYQQTGNLIIVFDKCKQVSGYDKNPVSVCENAFMCKCNGGCVGVCMFVCHICNNPFMSTSYKTQQDGK